MVHLRVVSIFVCVLASALTVNASLDQWLSDAIQELFDLTEETINEPLEATEEHWLTTQFKEVFNATNEFISEVPDDVKDQFNIPDSIGEIDGKKLDALFSKHPELKTEEDLLLTLHDIERKLVLNRIGQNLNVQKAIEVLDKNGYNSKEAFVKFNKLYGVPTEPMNPSDLFVCKLLTQLTNVINPSGVTNAATKKSTKKISDDDLETIRVNAVDFLTYSTASKDYLGTLLNIGAICNE